MGKTEVTNAQYRKWKPDHDSGHYKGRSLNDDNQPVVDVSWEDAKAFAAWLTQQNEGRYEFRLPTEAEWEYTCRAGTTTTRFWSDNSNEACSYANVHDQTSKRVNELEWEHHECEDGHAVTAPVGTFHPNKFKLHDMLGNVWEWCEDTYREDGYAEHASLNPINKEKGPSRVVRGGSWNDNPRYVRCANRSDSEITYRVSGLGFRLVREPL
jgi:formylglycine-generating enzyme required for sulfatase activity